MLSTTAAYAIYPMETQIQGIIESLNNAGSAAEDVCLLLAPTHPVAHAVRNAKVAPSDVPSDSAPSETLQWLSRFGAVIIPGVAFFVGSRVFLRAVLAPCTAIRRSASADRLVGLGLPPHEADRYGDRLNRGATMIFVCCSGEAQSHWITEVLRRTGAEQVSCLQEAVAVPYVETPESALQLAT